MTVGDHFSLTGGPTMKPEVFVSLLELLEQTTARCDRLAMKMNVAETVLEHRHPKDYEAYKEAVFALEERSSNADRESVFAVLRRKFAQDQN
jgi:hypothetical protein